MTSATWSLVWFTAFLLAEAWLCRDETLIAIKDDPNGAILFVLQGGDPQTRKELHLQERLSPECGSNSRPCQTLVMHYPRGAESYKAILIVPLTGGPALVEVLRNNYTAEIDFGQVKVLHIAEVRCSPSTVFDVQGNLFAVCTDLSSSSVYILEIILENDLLKSSYTYINRITLNPSLGNLTNITNFLHIEHLNYQFIIFGLGTALFSLRPYSYSEIPLRDIPSDFCDSVHWLAPNNGLQFWAYCSDYVVNYDVGAHDWREAYLLDEVGISFQCSQKTISINVFPTYINVTKDGLVQSIEKIGQDFVTGVCIGANYFVYVDRYSGIQRVNLLKMEISSIFQTSCGDNCLPPVAIDDRYLIVRSVQEGVVSVLDILNNSQKIIEVNGVTASLATLLTLPCPEPPEEVVPINLDEQKPSLRNAALTAGLAVGITIAIIIVTVAIVLPFALIVARQRWKRSSEVKVDCPIPDTRFNRGCSDAVLPCPNVHVFKREESSVKDEKVLAPEPNFSVQEPGALQIEPHSLESSQGEETKLLPIPKEPTGTKTTQL